MRRVTGSTFVEPAQAMYFHMQSRTETLGGPVPDGTRDLDFRCEVLASRQRPQE